MKRFDGKKGNNGNQSDEVGMSLTMFVNMLHVVIDTSIFKQNPKRDNASFISFSQLCESELVKLHIPYIIQEEFLSQRIADVVKPFNEIAKNMATLRRKEFSSGAVISLLQEQEKQLEEIKSQYIDAIKDDFSQG